MKPGNFRLRFKIHKNPIVGRPIANMSHSCLAPASLFLCQHLLPMQQRLPFAVCSSSQFLQRMPPVVNRLYEIATIDIKNLYPSIDTEDLISAISAQIFIFYSGEPLFAQTLINLLALILRNQMVEHRGELYVAFGIATGLSPGVFLANLYLDELDRKVVQQHSEKLGFFARLVDDSLVCALHVDDVLDTLNSWKPGIDWIVSARGGRSQLGEDEVPFLDIQLSHHMGHMAWRTFRKPLNRYLYLPRASAHPKNVFVALIAGETHRLWRSNRSRAHLFRELTFFVEKLADRGYARHVSWNVIRDTLKKCGQSPSSSSSRRISHRRFFHVAMFSSSLNSGVLKHAFRKHGTVLNAAFDFRTPLSVAYKVQPNQFRTHFADNWHWPVH